MRGIKLISPFGYTGGKFLDERQGLAKELRDLRDWDFTAVNIPDGFEVYVSNVKKWYYFEASISEAEKDPTTGRFKERKTSTIVSGGDNPGITDYNDLNGKPQIGGTTIAGNKTLDELGIQPKGEYLEDEDLAPVRDKNIEQDDRLSDIEAKLFPYTLTASITPTSVKEMGESVEYTITASASIKGQPVPGTTYTVDNVATSFPCRKTITGPKSFVVRSTSGVNNASKILQAIYSNRYYWGCVADNWEINEVNIKKLESGVYTPQNLTRAFYPKNQRIVFASLTEIKSFIDGSNFDNVANFDHTKITIINKYGAPYDLHVYKLKFTVTHDNFSITFKQ